MTQESRINYEGVPWPLTVPWLGSFVWSANPARDFPRHGVFATIEEHVVSLYRETMITQNPEVGELREDIISIFNAYCREGSSFTFADGIPTPDTYTKAFVQTEQVLLEERLSASFAKYRSEVNEIIQFCAKKSVMLAHPLDNRDSAPVRDAFDGLIAVSLDCHYKIAS